MNLRPTLRRSAELGIALTAIATLILAGCGGGGTGTSGGSVDSTSTTVTPFKGRFSSGDVSLTDANGGPVTLTSGGTINASGVAVLSYPSNVTYPLTINVTGTYDDETTGASGVFAVGSPLRGMIPAATDAQAASGVPVNIVTHIARATFPTNSFSAASAVAAITGVASSVLGVTSYSEAMKPPVFDAAGQTTDPATIKLAALAHVVGQQGAGNDLTAKLNNVTTQLATGSVVNFVLPQANLNAALASVNGGASSVVPAGSVVGIPAFTPPSGNLGGSIGAATPKCAAGQVLQVSSNGLSCVAGTGGGSGSTGSTMTIAYYTGGVMPGQSLTFYISGLTSSSTTSYQVNFGGNLSVAPSSVYAAQGNGMLSVTIPNDALSGTLTITNLDTNSVATLANFVVIPKPIVQATCSGGGITTILPASGVDATNWSNCSNQTPGDVQVVWGDNQFVAAGKSPSGNIKTSPDGYVWTNGSGNFDKVSFNGTRWIGLISNSLTTAISYSAGADPTSWTSTPITLKNPGMLMNAFAVNGRFFVSTNNDSFLTSTDGINWTETVAGLCGKGGWSAIVSAETANKVLWVNSKYLFYVRDASYPAQLACTSTDGVTWTGTPTTSAPAISTAFAHDGSKFVALDSATGIASIDVWTSVDGIAWIKSGYQVPLKRGIDLVWTGSQFIALGSKNQNTNIIDGIAMSSDGLNWTAVTSPDTSFYSLRNLAYSPSLNRVLSAGAYSPGGYYSAQNGLFVLHQVPAAGAISALPAPSGLVASATSSSQITVSWSAVIGAAGYNVYRSTTPGQDVSVMTQVASAQTATTFTDTGRTGSTTYYYKVTAIVDAVSTTAASAEASATTSVSWTNRSSTVPGSIHFQGVAYSGQKYIAAGTNAIYSSPDGITWSIAQSLYNMWMNKVVWNGSQFLIKGALINPSTGALQTPVTITSPDGVTWTSNTLPAACSAMGDVIWAGTQYVATVGANICTSPDGATWTLQNTGNTVLLGSIGWSGSIYVAAGASPAAGALLTSADGVNWTTQQPPSVTYTDSYYGAQTYFVTFGRIVFASGNFVSASGYTSQDGVIWSPPASLNGVILPSPSSWNGVTATQTVAGTDVTWTGTQFVIVGNKGAIYTSADGVSWATAPASTPADLFAVTSSGAQIVIVGYGKTIITSP